MTRPTRISSWQIVNMEIPEGIKGVHWRNPERWDCAEHLLGRDWAPPTDDISDDMDGDILYGSSRCDLCAAEDEDAHDDLRAEPPEPPPTWQEVLVEQADEWRNYQAAADRHRQTLRDMVREAHAGGISKYRLKAVLENRVSEPTIDKWCAASPTK